MYMQLYKLQQGHVGAQLYLYQIHDAVTWV